MQQPRLARPVSGAREPGSEVDGPVQTIWKYKLEMDCYVTRRGAGSMHLMMPVGAKILTLRVWGVPTIWALVDPHAALKPRTISFYFTGAEVAEIRGAYVGTFDQGGFVYHVFDEGHS